jgi:hypothetical protein
MFVRLGGVGEILVRADFDMLFNWSDVGVVISSPSRYIPMVDSIEVYDPGPTVVTLPRLTILRRLWLRRLLSRIIYPGPLPRAVARRRG